MVHMRGGSFLTLGTHICFKKKKKKKKSVDGWRKIWDTIHIKIQKLSFTRARSYDPPTPIYKYHVTQTLYFWGKTGKYILYILQYWRFVFEEFRCFLHDLGTDMDGFDFKLRGWTFLLKVPWWLLSSDNIKMHFYAFLLFFQKVLDLQWQILKLQH